MKKPVKFLLVYFLIFTFSYGILYIIDLLPEPTNSSFAFNDIVSSISSILLLGIIAGLLQLLGYILYLTNKNIDPNPVSWFMFAYGTGILMILEWDADASFAELFLPTICAVLAIVVSLRCWLRARSNDPSKYWPSDWWPEDHWEQKSFILDILITIGYITAWILATYAILGAENREIIVLVFLFLSNLSTFPSFYPILNETFIHPHKENWVPWLIWTFAYGILSLVTYQIHHDLFHPLMFYPVSNTILHAWVGWLARPNRKRTNRSSMLFSIKNFLPFRQF